MTELNGWPLVDEIQTPALPQVQSACHASHVFDENIWKPTEWSFGEGPQESRDSLWEACSGFHYLKLRCRLVSKCFRYCPWTVSDVMKHHETHEFNSAGFTLKIIALGSRLRVILHDQGHIHIALHNNPQSNSWCTATAVSAVSKQVVFQTRPEAVNVAGCCKLILFAHVCSL